MEDRRSADAAGHRPSVASDSLKRALGDYVDLANSSRSIAKTLATWSCRIHVYVVDQEDTRFTYVVHRGVSQPVVRGLEGVPNLIVRGHSSDLAAVFWGDANPMSAYMQGAITSRGSNDDVMKLDAMAYFIFLAD